MRLVELVPQTIHRPINVESYTEDDLIFSSGIIEQICKHGADPGRNKCQVSPGKTESGSGVKSVSTDEVIGMLSKLGLSKKKGEEMIKDLWFTPFTIFGASIAGKGFVFIFERPSGIQNTNVPYHFKVASLE